MSVADEIKTKLDIVSYIQQYVPLKKSGRTYKACCPWHAEKTPSFVVSEDRQSFRCFGACATGGDIFAFAMRHHGWSFTEALQELGKLAGVEVRKQSPEQKAQGEHLDALRGLLKTAAEAYHEALINPQSDEARSALDYALHKRGFSDETIRRFGIGFAPPGWHNMLEHLKEIGYSEEQILEAGIATKNDKGNVYDRFRNRLIIPIRDERGRVIGFGARALDPDDNPKYLNSPQTPLFDKSRTLFALDVAKTPIRDAETAVIVEGYVDAITAHQAGFTNVVAQMGTALTEHQLKLLERIAVRKLILALDSDTAGQSATERSMEVIRHTLRSSRRSGFLSVDLRIIQIPGAKDPDDFIRENPEQWQMLVDSAIPVIDYIISKEKAALPADATAFEREEVIRKWLLLLADAESDEKSLHEFQNVQKFALELRLNIPPNQLYRWFKEQGQIAKQQSKESLQQTDKPVARLQGVTVAPMPDDAPDVPPLDYDHSFVPPDDFDDEFVGAQHAAPVQRRSYQDAETERYCLKILFQNPNLYYAVNRKFRELAGSSRPLVDGPLSDWNTDDFTNTEYRALMQTFLMALAQDEMEVMDFLSANLDSTLLQPLEAIMIDELEDIRSRVRYSLLADLSSAWTHNQRTNPMLDWSAELVDKVLRLRSQRLQREREELCLLQIDSQSSGNTAAEVLYGQQVHLSGQAKHLIDSEIERHTSILRK